MLLKEAAHELVGEVREALDSSKEHHVVIVLLVQFVGLLLELRRVLVEQRKDQKALVLQPREASYQLIMLLSQLCSTISKSGLYP